MEQVNPSTAGNKNPWTWIVILAIPVIILVYIAMNRSMPNEESQSSVASNTAMQAQDNSIEVNTNSVQPVAIAQYKDGTYSAEGSYTSPGGPEQIGLMLVVENGVVTDSTFTPMAERPMSVNFQDQFANGYKEFVIGKKLDEISITKVSGSSLTPQGFTDALDKIKAEAAS